MFCKTILKKILGFVDGYSKCKMMRVSKKWKNIICIDDSVAAIHQVVKGFSFEEINDRKEFFFNVAIMYGNLIVAKWLYSIYRTDIFVTSNNNDNSKRGCTAENAYVWACINNYQEMAKWIYQISNIDSYSVNRAIKIVQMRNFSKQSSATQQEKIRIDNSSYYCTIL